VRLRDGRVRHGHAALDRDLDVRQWRSLERKADQSDAFDFDPARYVRQLVAGYSKNTADGGLRVYMPDFNEAAGSDLKP
jgi:hypothetical protein